MSNTWPNIKYINTTFVLNVENTNACSLPLEDFVINLLLIIIQLKQKKDVIIKFVTGISKLKSEQKLNMTLNMSDLV